MLEGPIGNGWVEEVKTDDGVKFIARWQYYVADPAQADGRRRESGYHEIGPKVYHGPEDALTSKRKAERRWDQIRDTIMGRSFRLPGVLKAEKTLWWFAEEDEDGFRRRREQRWSGGTPEWFDYITKKIYAKFGETKIKDLKEQHLQAFVNQLADEGYSQSVVKNTRLYIRAILEEAFQLRIIDINPAARLQMPRNTRKPQQQWLELEKYQAIYDGTKSQRDRLMMKILYIGGLRRGELFGLQWRDFDESGVLNIERQILEDLSVGPAKTDGSIAPVVISADIVEELKEWRKWCPNPEPEGWIFSTERKAHINPGHWRRTVLVPAGERVGIVRLNYQMFRRAFATEAHDSGMTDKNTQGQMRHTDPNLARKVYMQTIPASQRQAIEQFSKLVSIKKKSA